MNIIRHWEQIIRLAQVMNFKIIFLLFIFSLPLLLGAQSKYDKELLRNRSRLKQLQKEIEQIKEQISLSKERAMSISEQITMLDRELALLAHSRGLLERESRLIAAKVKETNTLLASTQARYDRLKQLYAQRLIYAYKYGRVRYLELLLTSESFNQAIIRYEYLRLIAEQDERILHNLEKKKREIEKLKKQLSIDLNNKRQNLTEKQIQQNRYVERMRERQAVLKKIRWTQSTYKKQLAQKELERKKLNGIIRLLEKQRLEREQKPATDNIYAQIQFDNFRQAKGKLPWPVQGKVITRYGKQRDPKSKTYINNTDIEISSTLGTPVHSVFKGMVSVITYMPAYGNTVIIDHGKGYYTVYAHLDEIYVVKNEVVETGQVIATVGNSGSFTGSKLQFGIYGGNKTYNPEEWLR